MNKPWSEKLHDVTEDVQRGLQKLQQIEEETGLTIEQVKDINRRMSIGEAKARRAKKEMVEANLRLVISIAKNTPTVVCSSGSDSGRQHRSDESGR